MLLNPNKIKFNKTLNIRFVKKKVFTILTLIRFERFKQSIAIVYYQEDMMMISLVRKWKW